MGAVGAMMTAGKYCTKCGERLDDDAAFCGACGAPVRAAPADGLVLDDDPVAPSVTVMVPGCEGALAPSGVLTMSVEPQYVVVSACPDDCDAIGHELVLTAEACERIRIAASSELNGYGTAGQQSPVLHVDWDDDGAGVSGTLLVDWTDSYLDSAAKARWEAGDRPDEADCGALDFSGGLTPTDTEAARFMAALTECAWLPSEWDSGLVGADEVRQQLESSSLVVLEWSDEGPPPQPLALRRFGSYLWHGVIGGGSTNNQRTLTEAQRQFDEAQRWFDERAEIARDPGAGLAALRGILAMENPHDELFFARLALLRVLSQNPSLPVELQAASINRVSREESAAHVDEWLNALARTSGGSRGFLGFSMDL